MPLEMRIYVDADAAGHTLYEKPLLYHDGKYFMFVPPRWRTALFKTFWFDLAQAVGAVDETARQGYQLVCFS
jgi:hypothetical protein